MEIRNWTEYRWSLWTYTLIRRYWGTANIAFLITLPFIIGYIWGNQ